MLEVAPSQACASHAVGKGSGCSRQQALLARHLLCSLSEGWLAAEWSSTPQAHSLVADACSPCQPDSAQRRLPTLGSRHRPNTHLPFPPCRQDHSFLLQAFRFFVRNNFLLDYAQGAPLQLPAPAAYPAPPQPPQWGRLPGEGAAAEQGRQLAPGDVRALLSAVAKEAVDVELSDEEDEEAGLLLSPSAAAQHDGCEDAGASSGGEEDEENSEKESGSGSSSSEAEEDEDGEEGEEEEAEEGQLGLLAEEGLAGHPGADLLAGAAGNAGVLGDEGENDEDFEYS